LQKEQADAVFTQKACQHCALKVSPSTVGVQAAIVLRPPSASPRALLAWGAATRTTSNVELARSSTLHVRLQEIDGVVRI
jgi:hypothetical protein